ncbi:WhiB family transcriptional regulator [Nocardia sp. NPDC023852]|uniref:WhiB family transcriptional regulator n=1 Tax=Nocardia sp. NPDC023852 TaxID=3154697 RepID=UPI0033E27BA9
MTSIDLSDPVVYADRACRGVPQDVFFPTGSQKTRIRRAQQICGRCPRLAACAAWAQPMAESAALSGCVVAGVYLPTDRTEHQAEKAAAIAALAYIAEHGALTDDGKGGASWTAA